MGQPGMPGSQFPGEDALIRELRDLKRMQQQFAAANVLATAGISATAGGVMVNGFMQFNREDGTLGVQVDPVTGTFTVYDATGTVAVARFGELLETAPAEYGVEVLVGATWVRLGAQAVTWDLISGKPSTYNTTNQKWTPDAHTHPGGEISSRVNAATDAIGSATGWANSVMGTEFYALWVGNDGSFSFGRNTSSLKYKENVRDAVIDPAKVLQLRPVVFDRKAQYKYPEDENGNRVEGPAQQIPGAKDEFGLIAEEVVELVPELAEYFQGELDSVRYERGFIALLPVVQQQAADIAALKQAVRDLGGNV